MSTKPGDLTISLPAGEGINGLIGSSAGGLLVITGEINGVSVSGTLDLQLVVVPSTIENDLGYLQSKIVGPREIKLSVGRDASTIEYREKIATDGGWMIVAVLVGSLIVNMVYAAIRGRW